MLTLTPYDLHMKLYNDSLPLKYSFSDSMDYNVQCNRIREKLTELLGMPDKKTEPKAIIQKTGTKNPEFDEIRFIFESEPDFYIPAHMLLPKKRSGKIPAVICLQGHTPGMTISLGRASNDAERETIINGDRDFAIQAVRRGYIAVAMEQRGFGELCEKTYDSSKGCYLLAQQALMLGRTLIGERCFDISRLIDAIYDFDCIDTDRIAIMGNSGGGTTSYYAAAVEPRLFATMPSCAFRMYINGQFDRYHCCCGYIPHILRWMDMPDVAILHAPRPLIIVAGKEDRLTSLNAVLEGFNQVQKIYTAAGSPDNCRLVVGENGHRFYADLSWSVLDSFLLSL